METMLQGLVIIGGLTFSLAASLLIEELIFGRIVRLAFAPRPAQLPVLKSQFPDPSSQFPVRADEFASRPPNWKQELRRTN
jgi:hypothetical protein